VLLCDCFCFTIRPGGKFILTYLWAKKGGEEKGLCLGWRIKKCVVKSRGGSRIHFLGGGDMKGKKKELPSGKSCL